MPTYEYHCPDCHHHFEELQSMKEPPLKVCPNCSGTNLHRLIGAGSGLIFRGSGFYITDYARKSSSFSSPGSEKSSKTTETKESKPSKSSESSDK